MTTLIKPEPRKGLTIRYLECPICHATDKQVLPASQPWAGARCEACPTKPRMGVRRTIQVPGCDD